MNSDSSSIAPRHIYYSLIQKVGDRGCYQWFVYIIGGLFWFLYGVSSFSIAFLFLKPGFDCSSLGIAQLNCEKYVCDHFDGIERQQYYAQKKMETLATQYGPYDCEKTFTIALFKSLIFFGMAISILCFDFFINNTSRKRIYLLCIGFAIVGSLILVLSQSMAVAVTGLFFIGLGIQIPVRFTTPIFTEITQPALSKRFTASLPAWMTCGGLFVTQMYGLIKDWRQVTLYFICISYLIMFLLVFFFFQDTPQSLLKTKTASEICQALNKIGKINLGVENIVSQEEVEEFLEEQRKIQKIKQSTNPLDLFRYDSLRKSAIAFLLFNTLINLIEFSHSMMIGRIGFNPTLNQSLINISSLCSLPFLIILSPLVPRKLPGLITMPLCVVFSLVTLLVQVPSHCDGCSEVFFQMGALMLTRFLLPFQFSIMVINMNEFFPVSIRSVAMGTAGAIGTFANAISLIVFTDIEQFKISPFLLVSLIFFVMVITYC